MFITHNLRTVVTSTQLWLISLVERVLVHVLSRGIFAIGNTWVHSTAIHNPKSIAFIKSLSSREIFLGDLNPILQQFDYMQVFRTHIFCTCLNWQLLYQKNNIKHLCYTTILFFKIHFGITFWQRHFSVTFDVLIQSKPNMRYWILIHYFTNKNKI